MRYSEVLNTHVPTLGAPAIAHTVAYIQTAEGEELLVLKQAPNEQHCGECGTYVGEPDMVVLDYTTFQAIHDELKLRGKI